MVIERKNRDANAPSDKGGPALVDHLVKKSLEINPQLRQQRTTGEVMAELKKQAQSGTGNPAGQPATSGHTTGPLTGPVKGAEAAPTAEQVAARVAAKRKVTVVYYLEQKADDYQRRAKVLQEREAQLHAERTALQQEILNDVVDFFTVVTFGAKGAEAQEALAAAGEYLQKLGITPAQLLQGLKSTP